MEFHLKGALPLKFRVASLNGLSRREHRQHFGAYPILWVFQRGVRSFVALVR